MSDLNLPSPELLAKLDSPAVPAPVREALTLLTDAVGALADQVADA